MISFTVSILRYELELDDTGVSLPGLIIGIYFMAQHRISLATAGVAPTFSLASCHLGSSGLLKSRDLTSI